MAEYLAPAVYVEEKSFRSKSIEGVSTSTAAFCGPARRGPASGTPELLTSLTDFERIYGGSGPLVLGAASVPNYLAHAVRAFFDNGGRRLYVRRVINGGAAGSFALTNCTLRARTNGTAGNGTVTLTEVATPVTGAAIDALPVGTVVRWDDGGDHFAYKAATGFRNTTDDAAATPLSPVSALTVDFRGVDADGFVQVEEDLGYHPSHARYIGAVLAMAPTSRSAELNNVFGLDTSTSPSVADLRASVQSAANGVVLGGGTDGAAPLAASYTLGLADLEALDDISTVAAPGHTEYDAAGIRAALITHVERRGLDRVALLESARGATVSDVRDARASVDSKYAAMYFPWIVVSNPLATAANASEPKELLVPPSGAVAGLFARSDNDNGVWKSPANEVVQGALRFERAVSFGESEVLNPLGVNCLRYFPGRGHRVWGARTISSDPEWKYLSVRRYFNYLEASIERGTQWAVFESNGPALWVNVTQTIDSFLYGEWRNGALLGSSPKEAYFVRCDLTTMTQSDLDNGRMICLIGVAVVKPAEFVIFRIGQKTATARS
ncbi:MAG: phage tail sheath subtilisin-like domain-containing protein [Myxococcota bacterium]